MPTRKTMKTTPNAGTPCLKGAGTYDDRDYQGVEMLLSSDSVPLIEKRKYH